MEEKMLKAPPEQVDLPKQEEETLLPPPHHALPKFALILFIILIGLSLLTGGFIYLNQPKKSDRMVPPTEPTSTPVLTPNPTADWKTYFDSKHRFSIKYPSDKSVEIQHDFSSLSGDTVALEMKIFPLGQKQERQSDTFSGELILSIRILETSKDITPEEYVKQNYPVGTPEITHLKLDKFSGVSFESLGVGYQREIILKNGKTLYFISGFSSTAPVPDLFRDMISTLIFTASDTSSMSIPWSQAVTHILTCNITSILQTHKLVVSMTLKNGSTVTTTEPSIDDVFAEVDKVKNTCGPIQMATE